MAAQCKQCGKSLVSTRAGSFTSYFFQQNYCQCNKQADISSREQPALSQVCTNCKKSVALNRAGSFTFFLFKELRCQCARPSVALAAKDKSGRTNAQTRRQAMIEKRSFTSSFKADASGHRAAQIDFSSGTVIGGVFKIDSKIGEGGMGTVYLAHHQSLGRPYALKILSPSIISEQSWLRFKAEAKTLSVLSHSGLVRVYDLGIHENSVPYYSMDYLEGETLEDLLVRRGPLALDRAITVFLSVLDTLAYAHRNNIVHRDIKPANIFLCRSGEMKILDFGISKLVGEQRNQELTAVGEVFGSPYYMSPEQCRGEHIDFRSDIYSMGCTLFETLTGYVPFESDSSLDIAMLHEESEIPLLADVGAIFLPPSLDVVIAKCLAKLPQERYQSAKEMAIDLTRISEGKSLETYNIASRIKENDSDQNFDQNPFASRNSSWLLPIVAIFLLCLGGGLVYFLTVDKPLLTGDEKTRKPATARIPEAPPMAELQKSLVNSPYANKIAVVRTQVDSPLDGEVKVFFAKPFKYFSQIITKDNQQFRGFAFPADFAVGTIFCREGEGKIIHEAKDTFLLPMAGTVSFEGNAILQFHPKLLSYFRSDDLIGLSLSPELTRVDLMLSNISRLTSLESLSLRRLVFNDSSAAYLNRLTKLRLLNLFDCEIPDKTFADLKVLAALHTLSISSSKNVSPLLNMLAKNPHLTSLAISYGSLSTADIRVLSTMHQLEKLSLRYTTVTNSDLKVLTTLVNLRELDLDATMVDSAGIESLLKFPKLERLVIDGLSADDEHRLQRAHKRHLVIE